jgi:hypothetical protein
MATQQSTGPASVTVHPEFQRFVAEVGEQVFDAASLVRGARSIFEADGAWEEKDEYVAMLRLLAIAERGLATVNERLDAARSAYQLKRGGRQALKVTESRDPIEAPANDGGGNHES